MKVKYFYTLKASHVTFENQNKFYYLVNPTLDINNIHITDGMIHKL